jgi:hypothetical protein
MTAFRDITPCSLLQVDGRFRDVYCLYQQSDDGGSVHIWNVGKLVVFSSSLVELTEVSDVFIASMFRVTMEAVNTSETSVNL